TECCPTRALHGGGGRMELRTEVVERSEGVVYGCGKLTGRLVTTVRRKVLPPDGVVDVTDEVERQVLLVQQDRGVVPFGAGLLQFFQGVIGALDVGGVVLVVVKFVDLAGDVWFQRSVVPVQIGQGVYSHGIPFFDYRLGAHSRGAAT